MKKTTMQDVADLAGVSKSTVSAVVNNKDIVRDETRLAVLRAIERLDYRPYGTVLPSAPPAPGKALCFVIKETDNPYYAEVIRGAEDVAREAGYLTFACSSGGDLAAEQRIVARAAAHEFSGLILTPILDADTDLTHVFDLRRSGTPFVLLEQVHGLRASLVDVDNVLASAQAMTHLLELGHTRLLHLRGPLYSKHSDERAEGVRRAFSESHVSFSDSQMVPAGDSLLDGYEAGLKAFRGLAPEDRPTGVTCYNDLVALGLMRALAELGVRVPDDVSVVGFDDLALLDYASLSLTTIHVPKQEMGRRAAEMLIAQIEEGASSSPKRVTLDSPLVVRDSTAPPPSVCARGEGREDGRSSGGGRPRPAARA